MVSYIHTYEFGYAWESWWPKGRLWLLQGQDMAVANRPYVFYCGWLMEGYNHYVGEW